MVGVMNWTIEFLCLVHFTITGCDFLRSAVDNLPEFHRRTFLWNYIKFTILMVFLCTST
jgi:hypothetical protein